MQQITLYYSVIACGICGGITYTHTCICMCTDGAHNLYIRPYVHVYTHAAVFIKCQDSPNLKFIYTYLSKCLCSVITASFELLCCLRPLKRDDFGVLLSRRQGEAAVLGV